MKYPEWLLHIKTLLAIDNIQNQENIFKAWYDLKYSPYTVMEQYFLLMGFNR